VSNEIKVDESMSFVAWIRTCLLGSLNILPHTPKKI